MILTRATATSASHPGAEAQRHTFVFADLAGFTALTEAHGDEHAADLVASFSSRVSGWLSSFGEGESKTIGDAIMIRLDNASGAVHLGLAIVERTSEVAGFLRVRVGMNTGTAVRRDGDWYGANVNLAARVAAVATGGQVLLTEHTLAASKNLLDVEIRSLGPRRFRNVAEFVTVYEAGLSSQPQTALSIDPVCKMPLRPQHAFGTAVFDGSHYLLCSGECARRFDAHPERYI